MLHTVHPEHAHDHGDDCAHTRVEHDDHIDYLHDGHLHHVYDGHVNEHTLSASAANPVRCDGSHACDEHDASHAHGPACGHETVPHDDHTDYRVGGHLHSAHGSHCDDHGVLVTV